VAIPTLLIAVNERGSDGPKFAPMSVMFQPPSVVPVCGVNEYTMGYTGCADAVLDDDDDDAATPVLLLDDDDDTLSAVLLLLLSTDAPEEEE